MSCAVLVRRTRLERGRTGDTRHETPEPGDIFGKVSFNLYLSDEPETKTYKEFFERYNDMLTDGEIIKIVRS